MNKKIKFLRTRLGQLIRDIGRKTDGDEGLRETEVLKFYRDLT